MKRKIIRVTLFVLACTGLALYGACQIKRRIAMKSLGNIQLVDHAVGSFLFGMPLGTQEDGWGWQGYKPGFNEIITVDNLSLEEFEKGVQKKMQEVKDKKHEDGGSMLEGFYRLDAKDTRSAFITEAKDTSRRYDLVETDAYHYQCLKKNLFNIKLCGGSRTPSLQHKENKELQDIFLSLRPRKPEEVPEEPGICYKNAFLANDPNKDKDYMERVSVGFTWPERPDVQFSIFIFSNQDVLDPSLLKRVEPPTWGCLRSGKRNAGVLEGEELLERVTESDGRMGHVFIWESRGELHRWDRPQLRFSMTTGCKGLPSSLSDKDALALWDAMVASIRVRPTKAKAAASEKPPAPAPVLPIGTQRKTGQLCPQTGIWQRGHGDREARQPVYKEQGEVLGRTIARRLRNAFRADTEDTIWTLVGYVERKEEPSNT